MSKRKQGSKKPVSYAQMQVRELAWLLYITCGYQAVVQKALTANSFTLDRRALLVMDRILRACELTESDIRTLMEDLQ